jgi:hypothetical protein
MIDKKTELNIKEAKSFFEFWMKFHSVYKDTSSKELITEDDEGKFLETKDVIREKYDILKSGLDFKYIPHSRLTDPVSDVLSVKSVRLISEQNLKKLDNDWKDSYIFLNNILERLKSKKRRMEQFNPIGVFLKRYFKKEKYFGGEDD